MLERQAGEAAGRAAAAACGGRPKPAVLRIRTTDSASLPAEFAAAACLYQFESADGRELLIAADAAFIAGAANLSLDGGSTQPPGPLSAIDIRLAARLAAALASALEHAFAGGEEDSIPPEAALVAIARDAADLRIKHRGAFEIADCADLVCGPGGFRFASPARYRAPVAARPETRAAPANWKPGLARIAMHAPALCRAVVGTARKSVSELMALAPGATLTLAGGGIEKIGLFAGPLQDAFVAGRGALGDWRGRKEVRLAS